MSSVASARPPAVVVTGGTSGIGLATVAAALRGDWTVVVLDVDPSGIGRCREQYADYGKRLRLREVDITDEEAVNEAIDSIERDVGPIIGLVNSAGIGRDVPSLETETQDFRAILEINLLGSFVVARRVAHYMVQRRAGSIVNIASVSGVMGNAGRVAYGAAKGGVITMTKVMAVELAPSGVRVNAVAPGPIETAMVRQMHTPAVREAWIDAVPMGRYGAAEEIATVTMFLLRENESSFVTGQTICADGGFTALGMRPLGQKLEA